MLLVVTLLTLLIILLIMKKAYRLTNGDLLNPFLYVCYFYLLRNLIQLLLLALYPEDIKLMIDIGNTDSNLLLLKYVLLHALFLFVLYLSFINGLKFKRSRILVIPDRIRTVKIFFFISFSFSVLGVLLYVMTVGSFINIIANFVNRVEVINENIWNQLTIKVTPFVVYSATYLYCKKSLSKRIWILCCLYSMLALMLFGSRTIAFTPILGAIVYYHYAMKRISFAFIKKAIFLFLLIFPFLRIISDLRNFERSALLMSDPIEYLATLFDTDNENETADFVNKELSGIYISVFILDHYNINNFWYGKGLLDLFQAPIPRKFNKHKPPVDEGRYVVAAVQGMDYSPSVPANNLPDYSWPPGTFGLGYINAGVVGVVIFSILLGRIQNYFYKRNLYRKSFVSIFLLFSVMQSFNISNLSIFNYIIAIIPFFFLYGLSVLLSKIRW